jgi:Mce-associated membrane protein
MSTITTQAGRAVKASRLRLRGAGRTAHESHETHQAHEPHTDASDVAATARTARLTPKGVWVLVALLLAGAVGLGATQGRAAYAAYRTDRAGAEALAAARQLGVNFVTVDYQQVDRDTARVKAGATGTFLESYTSSVAELKKVIVQNKTVSRAERTEAALVTGDLDSAVALVGVVAPTTNTSVPDGEKKTYRMRLELRKVSDAWKVENLEFVG